MNRCVESSNLLSQGKWYLVLLMLYFFYFLFLGLRQWHMEVPRLGVDSEPQLLACTTATAMQDPSHICSSHHSSWQCQVLSPLSEARDWTRNLMVPNQIHFCCAMMRTPLPMLYEFRLLMEPAFDLFLDIFPTSLQVGVSTFIIPLCVSITAFLFCCMLAWSHIYI